MKTIIIDGIEYNLTPKVLFKKGDWVVSPNGVYWHIDAIQDGRYQVSSDSGDSADWPLSTNIYHRFTIKDAKDGDVLYSLDSKKPFIYKERKPHEQATAYCGINIYGKFFVWQTKDCIITTDKYIPATKEQRELLFQKMKEAGYEWDAEKKKLKKVEQSPVWSEEDERQFSIILRHCYLKKNLYKKENNKEFAQKCQGLIDWLEAIKQRAELAVDNPNEKAIVKYLYEKKGYPIDLNGNLVSYEEAMKSANRYINYKKEKFIEKAEKYLREHLIDYWSQEITDESGFIAEFKKYMKGE